MMEPRNVAVMREALAADGMDPKEANRIAWLLFETLAKDAQEAALARAQSS